MYRPRWVVRLKKGTPMNKQMLLLTLLVSGVSGLSAASANQISAVRNVYAKYCNTYKNYGTTRLQEANMQHLTDYVATDEGSE